MADGVARVHGSLSSAVFQTHPGSSFAVEASTGPDSVEGNVWKEGEEGRLSLFNVTFVVEPGGTIRLEADFDRDFVQIDDVIAWEKAVWDGAASKGFPAKGWKY